MVRGADGEVRADLAGKAEGRGAYVCARPECAEKRLPAVRWHAPFGRR